MLLEIIVGVFVGATLSSLFTATLNFYIQYRAYKRELKNRPAFEAQLQNLAQQLGVTPETAKEAESE